MSKINLWMCKMFDLGYNFNFYFISVLFYFILFYVFILYSHGRWSISDSQILNFELCNMLMQICMIVSFPFFSSLHTIAIMRIWYTLLRCNIRILHTSKFTDKN